MRWGWFVILCALSAPGLSPCFADEPRCSPQSVLGRWEQASSGLLGVGPMEHRRVYELHRAAYSAHEISLLNEFRGPISAGDLAGRFHWTLEQAGEELLLVGEPVDEVEQLFYKRVRVSIDPITHLPQTVQFTARGQREPGEPLAVVLGPRTAEPNLFLPAPSARPLQYASRDEKTPRLRSPVRVVEHITRKPAPGQDLPAAVLHALSIWETSALEIQSLQANISRFTYEAETHIEQRAVGEFSYSNSPRVQCTLKPARFHPNERSHRRTADGSAYELLPSPAEYWQYSPTEIRFSHEPNKPVFVLHHLGGEPARVRVVSHEADGTRVREQIIPPWDMLFRVSSKSLAERFIVRLGENEHLTTWSFLPRQREDIGKFREMRVLLDNATRLPAAVQLVSHRGDAETVYIFHYTEVQRQKPAALEPQRLPIQPDSLPLRPAPTERPGQP